MFNKKLIAGGILAVASSAAVAAPSFSFTAKDYSAQGNLQVATVAGPAITTTLGANYAVDDLITFTFSDDLSAVPANTLTAYLQCKDAAGNTEGATGQVATNNGGTVTLGILTNDANTVTYRVTGLTYAVTGAGDAATKCITSTNSTVGGIFAMTPTFTGASVRASGATSATYSATLSNGSTAIDGGQATVSTGSVAGGNYVGNIVTMTDQFSAKIAAADALTGIIDVAPTVTGAVNRGVFTAASVTPNNNLAALSVDAFTITLAQKAAQVGPATVRSSVTTVLGDFSWIDDKVTTDTDTAVTGIDQNTVSATCNGAAAASVVVNADSATIGCAVANFGDIVVSFNNANNVGATSPAVVQTMMEGTYTASTVMTYTDLGTDGAGAGAVATNTVSAGAGLAAGGFGINGSTSVVQAYPVSDAITGFLWVTNAGTADAAMSVTAVADGSVMATCELGSVAGNSLAYVTAEVEACLTAASITSGRTQLSITVDAPAADINVYAGYKVDADSDRLSLTVN